MLKKPTEVNRRGYDRKKIFFNNPLSASWLLLENNPPVSKLTSPLSRGDDRVFQDIYSLYTLASPL